VGDRLDRLGLRAILCTVDVSELGGDTLFFRNANELFGDMFGTERFSSPSFSIDKEIARTLAENGGVDGIREFRNLVVSTDNSSLLGR